MLMLDGLTTHRYTYRYIDAYGVHVDIYLLDRSMQLTRSTAGSHAKTARAQNYASVAYGPLAYEPTTGAIVEHCTAIIEGERSTAVQH